MRVGFFHKIPALFWVLTILVVVISHFTFDLIAHRVFIAEMGEEAIRLAYLSIGEAENYRCYWDPAWVEQKPDWLDAENHDWPGNFKVRYWDKAWQQIIFGTPRSYLDRIMAAGFDDVYLDIIDAFEYYEEKRPTAARELIENSSGIYSVMPKTSRERTS